MKVKLLLIALVGGVMLLPSCNGCSESNRKTNNLVEPMAVRDIRIQDSLPRVNNAGNVVHETFAGMIPAADGPGINYELTLVHYSDLNSGVYKMKNTYIDGLGQGRDGVFMTSGNYSTYVGTPDNDAARYIKLEPFQNADPTEYFLVERSGAITKLDNNQRRIDSQHNYTLVRRSVN